MLGAYTLSDSSVLDLAKPQLMGILNVTPDSFSDGGLFIGCDAAIERARSMVAEGASIIDVGGESTRPGARPVSVQEEIRRIIPIIEAISTSLEVTVSIDTSKPEVMAAALAAGASMINDVQALGSPAAIEVAANSDVPICLMHMIGTPQTMQQNPEYKDVVSEVIVFLQSRIAACISAGIARERLIIDPGFGFSKTLQHNLELAQNLDRLCSLGLPILVGVSRKSMFGAILDADIDKRLYGCLGMTALLLGKGASIFRTHDVAPTRDVLKVVQAMRDSGR